MATIYKTKKGTSLAMKPSIIYTIFQGIKENWQFIDLTIHKGTWQLFSKETNKYNQ